MSKLRSSFVIAKRLASEGFSDHVANMVERYWVACLCRPGGRKNWRRLDKALAEMCKKLTDADKLVLGKFIAMHKKMSFDTGLNIGLTVFARKGDKEYELYEQFAGRGDAAAIGAENAGTTSEEGNSNVLRSETNDQSVAATTTTRTLRGSADHAETGRVKLSGVQDHEDSAQVVGGDDSTKVTGR